MSNLVGIFTDGAAAATLVWADGLQSSEKTLWKKN